MPENEDFFYGTADPFPSGKQYSLYNIAVNRFLLVSPYYDVMETLSFLFSSRYQFKICRLDQADNYEPNLIDNTLCHHWSFDYGSQPNPANMNTTSFIHKSRILLDVNKLKEIGEPEHEKIFADMEYLRYAHNLIHKLKTQTDIKTVDSEFLDYTPIIDGEFGRMIDLPMQTEYEKIEKKVFSIIYRIFDLATAKEEIAKIWH